MTLLQPQNASIIYTLFFLNKKMIVFVPLHFNVLLLEKFLSIHIPEAEKK